MSLLHLLALSLAGAAQGDAAAAPDMPLILPLRERAALRDRWLRARLDALVPALMRREGVDAWVLVAREYNDDPVLRTMLPATWMGARRRTILLFVDHGPERGVERLAIARYAVGDLFPKAWDKEAEPDQWARLAALLAERDLARIAVDCSPTFALADGLTASERAALEGALPPDLVERLVGAERLAVGWLETRTADELAVYPHLCRLAHRVIAEGLSDAVVLPGHTTTEDLAWWYRERIAALKLDTWFHPLVSVQRAGAGEGDGSFADGPERTVIRRGDLIHVDVGIAYLGLHTDTQHHAYVLRPGEEQAPEGLRRGLGVGNRLQDLLTASFAAGRTGNEVLAAARAAMQAEGIDGRIYTHPLGVHGHAAGPTIGLWDQQQGVPGPGDHPLFPDTCYAIELGVRVDVPEWGGQRVDFMLEEDAHFDGTSVRYLDGRQTALTLIP